MKEAIADKWVEALRSGEFEQTAGVLAISTRTAHCCLGVLCEVAIKNGLELSVAVPKLGHSTEFDGCAVFLPDHVAEWAGLMRKGESVLSSMNDAGKTFAEIADRIEADWEEL